MSGESSLHLPPELERALKRGAVDFASFDEEPRFVCLDDRPDEIEFARPGFTQEIIEARPPLFDVIADTFPGARRRGVIFSWGSRLYNPSGVEIPPELIAHEAVHGARQGTDEGEIRDWWISYITDKQFRLAEELAAHRAEYRWLEQHGTRQQRRSALKHVAHRLAAPLYGRMVTPTKAKSLLR